MSLFCFYSVCFMLHLTYPDYVFVCLSMKLPILAEHLVGHSQVHLSLAIQIQTSFTVVLHHAACFMQAQCGILSVD